MRGPKIYRGTALTSMLLVLACADHPNAPINIEDSPMFATSPGACDAPGQDRWDDVLGGGGAFVCGTTRKVYVDAVNGGATVLTTPVNDFVDDWNAGVEAGAPNWEVSTSGQGLRVWLSIKDVGGNLYCGRTVGGVEIQRHSGTCGFGGSNVFNVPQSGIEGLVKHEIHSHVIGRGTEMDGDDFADSSWTQSCPTNSQHNVAGLGCAHEYEAFDWLWGIRPAYGVDWNRPFVPAQPDFALNQPDSIGDGVTKVFSLSSFSSGNPDAVVWTISDTSKAEITQNTLTTVSVRGKNSTAARIVLEAESQGKNVRFPWPRDTISFVAGVPSPIVVGTIDSDDGDHPILPNDECVYWPSSYSGGGGTYAFQWQSATRKFGPYSNVNHGTATAVELTYLVGTSDSYVRVIVSDADNSSNSATSAAKFVDVSSSGTECIQM